MSVVSAQMELGSVAAWVTISFSWRDIQRYEVLFFCLNAWSKDYGRPHHINLSNLLVLGWSQQRWSPRLGFSLLLRMKAPATYGWNLKWFRRSITRIWLLRTVLNLVSPLCPMILDLLSAGFAEGRGGFLWKASSRWSPPFRDTNWTQVSFRRSAESIFRWSSTESRHDAFWIRGW